MIESELRDLLALPLALRARVLARSLWAGVQITRKRGSGGTFRELRLYRPGDPLRRIDWRASARLDRWMVRETDRISHYRIALMLDRSESMQYRHNSFSKDDIAVTLAATVGLHALKQGHAVGLIAKTNQMPAGTGRTTEARLLQWFESEPPTALPSGMHPGMLGRADLLLVIGDFFDPDSFALLSDLALLRARGVEVRLLQILHRDELELPFRAPRIYVPLDGPGIEPMQLLARDVRAGYLEAFGQHQQQLLAASEKSGLLYHRQHVHDHLLNGALFLSTGIHP